MVSLFFSFKGRVNRATYWLGNLIVGFVGFFGIFFGIMLAGSQGFDKSAESVMRVVSTMGLTIGPVMLAMSWASLALQVKRFHDRGRSGLFTLLPIVPVALIGVTVIGGAASGQTFQHVAAQCQIYINILFLINLGFFIDLGCLPGKDGPNTYGNPPGGGFSSTGGGPAPAGVAAAPGPVAPAGGANLAFLGNADKAIERAIAEQARAQPAPARPAAPAARPSVVPTPAPTGFGRRPAR